MEKKLASLLGENEALRRGFMRAKGTNFKQTRAFAVSVFRIAKESIEKAQDAGSTAKRLYEDKGFRENYLNSLKKRISSFIEGMKDSVEKMTFKGFVANLVRLVIDVRTFAYKYYSQRSSEDAKRHGESEEFTTSYKDEVTNTKHQAPAAKSEETSTNTTKSLQKLSTIAGDDVYAAMQAQRDMNKSKKRRKRRKTPGSSSPSTPTSTSGGMQ